MTRYEIEEELDGLYRDFDFTQNSDNQTVCRAFNVDSKKEYMKFLVEEIDKYEAMLDELDIPDDDGMDYDTLCRIQGLSRYA